MGNDQSKKDNKDQMERLESINGELFQSFDPDDESWVVGGSFSGASGSVNGKFKDGGGDFDLDFDTVQG
jgi:hypothetical protein